MKNVKYRVYNKIKNCMFYFDLSVGFVGTDKIWSDVMLFTGLKDKNGVDIF